MMDNFAAKWFALYYPVLGCIFLVAGIGLMIKTKAAFSYLHSQSENEQPPALLRSILKYFFLFTLPCLALSFFPFSWPDLLFSLWSFIIVFTAGPQLVRWPQSRKAIKDHPQKMRTIIKLTGAVMVAVSIVMFLLGYLVIQ